MKSDSDLLALNKGANTISNPVLRSLMPQGIAFHNAGLTLQDRITV